MKVKAYLNLTLFFIAYIFTGMLAIKALSLSESSIIYDHAELHLKGFLVLIWPLALLVDGVFNIGLKTLGEIVVFFIS